MTKIFNIISLNNYLYAVEVDTPFNRVATTDTSLGLPLLPAVKDDKEIFVVLNPKGGEGPMYHTYRVKAFEDLEDAKHFCKDHPHLQIVTEWVKVGASKKYTDENVIDFLKFLAKDHNHKYYTQKDAWDDFKQSLNPIPKHVELEMEMDIPPETAMVLDPYKPYVKGLKVTDGFVHVVKWIYETI